ncbi:MAG TPA: DUF1207 domain-containing protein [Stellaceae bacterium]
MERPLDVGDKVQLLPEYYIGHNRNGQFYLEQIEFLGVGAHFYF